jgi:hypothetical protein
MTYMKNTMYSCRVKTACFPRLGRHCTIPLPHTQYNSWSGDITTAASTNSKSKPLWSSKILIVYVLASKEGSLQLLKRKGGLCGRVLLCSYWLLLYKHNHEMMNNLCILITACISVLLQQQRVVTALASKCKM